MTTQTAFRLPDELVDKIDRYAAHLTEKHGIDVSRADAVRLLLKASLDAPGKLGLSAPPKPAKKGKKR